jgi:cyanate permease
LGTLIVLSVLVAGLSQWYGMMALWWAIASFMFGLLICARLLPIEAMKGADWAESLGEIVRLRRFWVLVVVSISINVCWHFLISWLPTYLKDDRGMTYLASGMLSALPFLAADFGNLGGGWFSRALASRGLRPSAARLRVMTGCSLLISSGALVGLIREDWLAIVLLGVMALGTAAFMANYFAFCQEVSGRHTGLVVGVLGGLGNLVVAFFLPIAGRVKDVSGSFAGIFVIVGLLPFVGLGALWIGWRAGPDGAKAG